MKRVKTGFLLLLLFLGFQTQSFGRDVPVRIAVNGNFVKTEETAILREGTVYAPVRFLSELFGMEVLWDGELQSISMTGQDKEVLFIIGQNLAIAEEEVVELSSTPFVKEGKSYLPLRFLAEQLGVIPLWNQEVYDVELVKEGFVIADDSIDQEPYTEESFLLLAKIIEIETGNASLEERLAVANVVLNRVKSASFPNTLSEVIFQKGKYAQFPPAHTERFANLIPDTTSKIAAKLALSGENNVENCLYFNNRPFSSKEKDFYRKIGAEYFYR